jgi:hypothetical protein
MVPQKARKIKSCEVVKRKPADQGLRILASILARHYMAGLSNRPVSDQNIQSNDISNEMNDE